MKSGSQLLEAPVPQRVKKCVPKRQPLGGMSMSEIAHALSLACVFGGRSRCFYSLGQRCLLVSRMVDQEETSDRLWGLLIEVPTVVLGESSLVSRETYLAAVKSVQQDLSRLLHIPLPLPTSVVRVYQRVTATEARDLMRTRDVCAVPPYPFHVEADSTDKVKELYLHSLEELGHLVL